MDDIVERLRSACVGGKDCKCSIQEAASLIERQRACLEEMYEALSYIKTRERVLSGMSIASSEIKTKVEMDMIRNIHAAALATAKTLMEE